jgi:putative ABC transport system permease protein
MYESEQVIGALARLFTLLALLIACLGLFGLAAYAAEQRTREIGVRKTLGASVSSVVMLLSRDFLKLVALAFIAAVPVAYLVAESWLSSFAYRIDLGAWMYVAAGLGALVVAGLTVGVQSVRAALMDPVAALRRE